MNSIVSNYRSTNPEDKRSDEEIMDLYANSYPPEQLAAYPDFLADYQQIQRGRAVDQSSVGEELSRGFSRGMRGLQTAGAGALALASDAVGARKARNYWLDVYRRKTQETMDEVPASVPKIEEAGESVSSAAQYVAGKAGELVPNIGEALVFAGAGTLVAPGPGTVGGVVARGAARAALKRSVEKAVTPAIRKELEEYAAGRLLGTALSQEANKVVTDASKYLVATGVNQANFATIGGGEMFGRVADQPGVTEEAARESAVIGAFGGSIGSIIPLRILKGIFGESIGEPAARSYVDLYAKKIPSELLTAGGGMGAQEFFNVLAEKHADPKKRNEPFTSEDYSRILNGIAIGLMAGAPASAIAAVRGVKPRAATAEESAAPSTDTPVNPTLEPAPEPSQPPPAMTAEQIGRTFPAEISREQELLFQEIATAEVDGTITDAQRTYLEQLPPNVAAKYEVAKQEVIDAAKARQEQEGLQQQRKRADESVEGKGPDRKQPEADKAEGDEAGPGDQLQQAASELTAEAKVALKAAGIEPEVLLEKAPEPKPAPAWIQDRLKEREAQGWDPKWPFVQADLFNPTFRDGILRDPTLTIEQKRAIYKFAPPETLTELEAYEASLATTERQVTQPSETQKGRQEVLEKPPVAAEPPPVAPEAAPPVGLAQRAVDTIAAWRTPRKGKAKEDMYSDLGRDTQAPGNKSRTKTLGVFRAPSGSMVVASIYNNRGEKVFIKNGGISFEKAVEQGYEPIGYVKTKDAQEKFYVEQSPEQWAAEQSQLEGKVNTVREDTVLPTANAALGMEAVATGELSPEGLRAAEKPEQFIQNDLPGKLSRQDAEALFVAVNEDYGIPEVDTARDNIIDTLGDNPQLARKLYEVGQDNAIVLIDRIIQTYEATISDFEKSGRTDPGEFRSELLRRLERVDAKVSKAGEKTGGIVPEDLRQSRPADPSREPSSPELAEIATHVMGRLVRSGVTVERARAGAPQLLGEYAQVMGSYDRARKAVTLVMSDVTAPNREDVRILFEETAHVLFDRESPEVSRPILRAMARLGEHSTPELDLVRADIENAYPDGVRPDIYQEELLAGLVSRRLQAEGFNPTQSFGIASSIVRLVKDLYLRGSMWLQKTLLGEEYINPDLAIRYFQNRVEAFMAGDRGTPAWLDRLGGGTPVFSTRLKWHDPAAGTKDIQETYNSVTGQIDAVDILPESVEAAMLNARGDEMRYSVPAPLGPQPQYVDSGVRLNRQISVINKVEETRSAAVRAAGVDGEAFRKMNGLTSTAKRAGVIVQRAAEKATRIFRPDQKIEEFTVEENRQPSFRDAAAMLMRERAKISTSLARDKESLPLKQRKHTEAIQRANEELAKYADATYMASEIRKEARDLAIDDIRLLMRGSKTLGTIMQQVRNLDGQLDRPVDPSVVQALRKLFTGEELTGERLFDVLDYMANDGDIDFTRPAREIRDQIRATAARVPDLHYYQRITSSSPEGRALLATVIAYGKVHARTVGMLRLRRMRSGEDRVRVEAEVKALWKETSKQIEAGVRRVTKATRIEDGVKAEYRKTLRQATQTKRVVEHLENRIRMNEAALPEYQKQLDVIANELSQAVDTTFGDKMIVRLPKTNDLRPEWEEVTINLNAVSGPVTTAAEWKGMTDRLALFCARRETAFRGGDQTALGAEYQNAKRQLTEILYNRLHEHAIQNVDKYATGLALANAPAKVEAIGTPAAIATSRMIRKMASDTAVFRTQADKDFGFRSSRLERNLLGVINQGRRIGKKVDQSWFDQYVVDTAIGFMEKQQGSEGGDRATDLNNAYSLLGDWMMRQDNIRPFIQDRLPQFMSALRELIELRYEAGQSWRRRNVEAGLLVEDPKLGGQLRSAFRVGLITVPRKFADGFRNMVYALRMSGWVGNGVDRLGAYGDFAKIKEAYAAGGEAAVDALIEKYVNHPDHGETVKMDFLHRLFHVPDESVFEGPPIDESGTTGGTLDPATSAAAYDQAGGNLRRTFEIIWDMESGVGDREQYVQDSLIALADQFNAVDKALKAVEPTTANQVTSFVGLVPNAMIDARQYQYWPAEWFTYHKFDRNDNARLAERVAAQINFGRDTRTLANLHETLTEEVNSLVSKLRSVEERSRRNTPTARKKDMDREMAKILETDTSEALKSIKGGKARLDFLRRTEDKQPFVGGFLADMHAYFSRSNDQSASLSWGIRLAQELSSLLVNQPSSAISQLATMFDIPMQWGASATMLGATGTVFKMTAKDIAGSLAQAIGYTMKQTDWAERKYRELGLVDSEVARKAGDIFATMEGEASAPAARAFRIAKDIQSAPVNRVGDMAGYTPFRPLAPFFQFVQSANKGITIAVWRLSSNYVAQGLKYLKSHPGDTVTAEKLGLKGIEKDSFDRWNESIERYGMKFSELVAGAEERSRTGDSTVLTDRDLGRLYSMGLNEISLESSIATMPLSAFNNRVLKFVLPLIGWSYRRALQVGDRIVGPGIKAITERDKDSLKAVSRAMLGLATTGLGGLAISLVVDEYQEELLGKRRNIRDLRVPTSGEDWLAIQERLARSGTLGLWGEMINSAVNTGTGQGDNRMLSLDQRVIALQSFQSIQRAIGSFIHQDFDADYQHVVRPAIAALGGNGMLQYAQLVNNAFGLDNAEARIVKRINAQNWLRVVGRDSGLSIRGGGANQYATPTPITPWLARMEFAAYANSPDEFRQAYRGAIQAAKDSGREDPVDAVKRGFATRHPVRFVFASAPSEGEYRLLLNRMNEDGQSAVKEAVSLFNYYGTHIGLDPYQGSTKKRSAADSAARARQMALR